MYLSSDAIDQHIWHRYTIQRICLGVAWCVFLHCCACWPLVINHPRNLCPPDYLVFPSGLSLLWSDSSWLYWSECTGKANDNLLWNQDIMDNLKIQVVTSCRHKFINWLTVISLMDTSFFKCIFWGNKYEIKKLNLALKVDGVLQIFSWFPFLILKAGFYNSENTDWVAISCQHTNQK